MNNTLQLTRPMMHGPAVKRLQELGDMIGFDGGPNDGVLGPDTQRVILDIQGKLGLKQDGICGPLTWRALNYHVSGLEKKPLGEKENVHLVDIRGTHPSPKLYSRKRKWSEITGVTLHQTGCDMPENPAAWKRLNAHIGILRSGICVIVNKSTDMIYHAQGLSPSTIGIEIEGNFCGIAGNKKTLWKGGGGPHTLTDKMIDALYIAFDFIRQEFRYAERPWLQIHAHRQSSRSRRGDPGSEIWQKVAMPWAARLGLSEYDGGAGWHKPKGLPIPQTWNPEYKGKY